MMTGSERRRLAQALRKEKDKKHYQRLQMVMLRAQGLTQPAIAAATGTSRSTVNRAHMAYDRGGLEALRPKPRGGRIRANMTMAEEKALIAGFVKAAGAGELWNIHEIKAAYERAIGRRTGETTIYGLLARHGWRKLLPRPHHPQRDLAAQSSFKKRFPQSGAEGEGRGGEARTPLESDVLR